MSEVKVDDMTTTHSEGDPLEDFDDQQLETKNQQFQEACKIWFCPTEERIKKELREMPQQEREKVWADLSGNEKTSQFKKDVVENSDRILKSLEKMAEVLKEERHSPGGEALGIAQRDNPEYINSQPYKLVFLRSCEYDGGKAGHKLLEHMATKRRLFGEECLGREVKQSDLNPDDMQVLRSGWLQFLSERDDAGRLVLYNHFESMKYKERENLCRVLFYVLTRSLMDESVQKLGIVVVWNLMSDYGGGYDYEANRMVMKTVSTIPVRPVARYIIYKSGLWNQVLEVNNHFISPHLRARTRSIQGSYSEAMFSLMALGLPCHSIPTSAEGKLPSDNLCKWIREQERKEHTWSRKHSNDNVDSIRLSKRRRVGAMN